MEPDAENETLSLLEVCIANPGWVQGWLDPALSYPTDEDMVRVAVALARENVLRGTGGPFGAAVFDGSSGRLVAVGVNSVVRLHNSLLHAEVMALMLAEAHAATHSLRLWGQGRYHLAASCDPCAMCLGAVLWSGVGRLVCGASRRDAEALGFDEGPVDEASYGYLESRGIGVVRGLLAEEAREPFRLYGERKGVIYNG